MPVRVHITVEERGRSRHKWRLEFGEKRRKEIQERRDYQVFFKLSFIIKFIKINQSEISEKLSEIKNMKNGK